VVRLYCDWDGILWRCRSDKWADQLANCDHAYKMPGRKKCMFLCDNQRCDCVECNKGRAPVDYGKKG